jgi:hypothetical protein
MGQPFFCGAQKSVDRRASSAGWRQRYAGRSSRKPLSPRGRGEPSAVKKDDAVEAALERLFDGHYRNEERLIALAIAV